MVDLVPGMAAPVLCDGDDAVDAVLDVFLAHVGAHASLAKRGPERLGVETVKPRRRVERLRPRIGDKAHVLRQMRGEAGAEPDGGAIGVDGAEIGHGKVDDIAACQRDLHLHHAAIAGQPHLVVEVIDLEIIKRAPGNRRREENGNAQKFSHQPK
jgi:hypothetical protein